MHGTLGKSAFSNAPIEQIIVPCNVEYIGDGAFYQCGLKKVILHEGLKEIDYGAFFNTLIKQIVIPSTVEIIGNMTFAFCGNLKEVIFNEGLKKIGDEAFRGTQVKQINIPSTVEMIGTNAFDNCKQLEEVVISASSKIANYDKEKLEKIFGKKAKIVIDYSFRFDEGEFNQRRQMVNEEMANKLGIKLINLVNKDYLNEEDLELAYELLVQGANPNIRDFYGNTGLMYMINKRLNEGIKMYLASGCDINIANNMGDTAIIHATRGNMVDIVARLIDMGAYYKHQNINDESALSIAKDNNYQEIVDLIESIDKMVKPKSPTLTKKFDLKTIKDKARKLNLRNKGV